MPSNGKLQKSRCFSAICVVNLGNNLSYQKVYLLIALFPAGHWKKFGLNLLQSGTLRTIIVTEAKGE